MPRLFSRARAVIGPPVMIPADLDRAGLEPCRLRTERLLNCLTAEAEAWAAAGTRKAGEVVIRRQFAPPPRRRQFRRSPNPRSAPRARRDDAQIIRQSATGNSSFGSSVSVPDFPSKVALK